ncbi:unnamed protein product, partial [Heterosigma akashiwo]
LLLALLLLVVVVVVLVLARRPFCELLVLLGGGRRQVPQPGPRQLQQQRGRVRAHQAVQPAQQHIGVGGQKVAQCPGNVRPHRVLEQTQEQVDDPGGLAPVHLQLDVLQLHFPPGQKHERLLRR